MRPLRILLAGGGTGGHIYPLLSLATEFRRRDAEHQLLFVGAAGRMEADLVPRAGWDIELLKLPAPGAAARSLGSLLKWPAVWRRVWDLFKTWRPDLVVGAGGQVCAPVVLAAAWRKVPRVLLEPNAVPGRANLMLAHWAAPELIAILMPKAREKFASERVEELGYPLRPELFEVDRAAAVAELGLDPDRRTVLVFGGSLGSQKINEALVELLPTLTAGWAAGVQFLHLGGRVNARTLSPTEQLTLNVGYVYRDYLHEMGQALAAADLVVGRAGAMSLAELTAFGLPAILIPFPAAADNHQQYNAEWMATAGAAVVLPDAELTGYRLGQILDELLTDEPRLLQMAEASRKIGWPDAASALATRIEFLLEREGDS